MTDSPVEADGRRLRREQNRDAVLDALVSLFREGAYQPSANEIAERAGLSPRSLFRYFDDVDDLNSAAIERQLLAARPLLALAVGPEAPAAAKVAALVDARARLYEEIAPAARAARVCAHRHPVVARQVHDARSYLRHQIRRLFAPELEAGVPDAALAAADALCSFEAYEILRHDQGLSKPRAAAALVHALTALLVPSGG